MLLGIDTGGTFTDFVLFHDGTLKIHKVLSTPDFPEKAILQGFSDLGLQKRLSSNESELLIVHGSTVATNAVLERKGVKTVYVANKGLSDVLTIARQTRPELYSLQGSVLIPPVEKQYCLEADTRTSSQGEELKKLTDFDCKNICDKINELNPESVAINFLFSYLNSDAEKKIFNKLSNQYFVSCSSMVLPELKEYERGIATWLNSYVGPLVKGYIERLQHKLPNVSISVMQSSGGTIDVSQAGDQAVRMLLSGPAGGMAGAKYMADVVSNTGTCSGILTFDMGGTSTDVAMIDKQIQLTTDGYIGEFPVAVPMVDMHTIGAGGGSIATVDSGGVLQVGPDSAGANPGPACYGNHGTFATVTDANLILGRLQKDNLLAGNISLDVDAAIKAIEKVAELLSLDIFETALGIIQIANEHMAQALRVMSVQRGLDPRILSLVSFGGAGSLHVCALADSLSMTTAIVPVHGGVLSAFGMLVAPKARYLSHALTGLVENLNYDKLNNGFDTLLKEGIAALKQEGVSSNNVKLTYEIDLRYAGQSSFITVLIIRSNLFKKITNLTESIKLFHQQHLQRFGHQMDMPIEIVNIRLTFKSDVAIPKISNVIVGANSTNEVKQVSVHGFKDKIFSYQRNELKSSQIITGPALIIEKTATTFLEASWQAEVVEMGNLLLTKKNI